MAQTPKPEEEESAALEILGLFTPAEFKAFQDRATFWMSGPEGVADLEEYLQHKTLTMMQVSAQIATGEKTLTGRSGLNIWARTIRDFPVQAQRVLDILSERETKGKK